MNNIVHKFNFILFDFRGEEMARISHPYKQLQAAIGYGGMLIWNTEHCARVIIEDEYGFHMTLEWGIRIDS